MQKKRNTKRCKDKKKLPTTSRDNGISIIFQEKERERERSEFTDTESHYFCYNQSDIGVNFIFAMYCTLLPKQKVVTMYHLYFLLGTILGEITKQTWKICIW